MKHPVYSMYLIIAFLFVCMYFTLPIVSSIIASHFVPIRSLSCYLYLSASSFFRLSFFHPSRLFETCMQKWFDSWFDFQIHNTHTLSHTQIDIRVVCCVVSVIGGHSSGKHLKSTCCNFNFSHSGHNIDTRRG